ncbi:MAG: hypothetical protein JOY85_07305 [Acidobacteriaceae bacterium]|nr:hypothetical protein [Acidobacteriaceae bacterium]
MLPTIVLLLITYTLHAKDVFGPTPTAVSGAFAWEGSLQSRSLRSQLRSSSRLTEDCGFQHFLAPLAEAGGGGVDCDVRGSGEAHLGGLNALGMKVRRH